jgi:hypothetical protein
MTLIRRSLPLVLLFSLAGPAVAGSPIKTPPKKSKIAVYDQVTLDQLVALFDRRGIETEVLAQAGRHTAVKFTLSGLNVLLVMADEGSKTTSDGYLYAAFQLGSPVDVNLVNAWNLEARWTRAYVDGDGDAVLESDIRWAGGITEANFNLFIDSYAQSLSGFTQHIGFNN